MQTKCAPSAIAVVVAVVAMVAVAAREAEPARTSGLLRDVWVKDVGTKTTYTRVVDKKENSKKCVAVIILSYITSARKQWQVNLKNVRVVRRVKCFICCTQIVNYSNSQPM